MSKHTSLGNWGEQAAWSSLRLDYHIKSFNRKHGADMTITTSTGHDYKIEVKTGKRANDGTTQFCLERAGRTSVKHADIVVFIDVVCEDCYNIYVVPVNELPKIKTLKIRANFKPHRLSQYQVATVRTGVAKYVN